MINRSPAAHKLQKNNPENEGFVLVLPKIIGNNPETQGQAYSKHTVWGQQNQTGKSDQEFHTGAKPAGVRTIE